MLAIQRQEAILDYLRKHTYADVDTLSTELGISPTTVRRDLRLLGEGGIIARTRGGAALPVVGVGHEPPYAARAKEHQPEKRAIAALARTILQEGQVVGLDVGSTTLEVAKLLPSHQRLTVFTSSLPIAEVLLQSAVSVILVGGVLRKKELAVSGPIAVQTINQFHFDLFLMGTAGVSLSDGLTDFSIEDIEIKKAFIARSTQVIALADSSKLGQVAFAKICDLERIQALFTDAGADPVQVEQLSEAGVRVRVAGAAPPPRKDDDGNAKQIQGIGQQSTSRSAAK